MSIVSNIPHETREIQIKEQITIESKKGKQLTFSLVDTPGIATKIDYEEFIKKGLKENKDIELRALKVNKRALKLYLSLGFAIKSEDETHFHLIFIV